MQEVTERKGVKKLPKILQLQLPNNLTSENKKAKEFLWPFLSS